MHRSMGIGLGLAALMAVALGLWFFATNTATSYAAQGRIAGFSNDPHTVIIEHEDIAGFMPAMTMPFNVKSAAELSGLEAGDAITFTLRVTQTASWIEDLVRISETALAPARVNANPGLVFSDSVSVLLKGDRMTDFSLINQDGQSITYQDFAGKTLVLTFIYTRCPLPDYCPLMSQHFQQIQRALDPAENVVLLSISFDPTYDTPEVLRAYAHGFTDDLHNWTFATGTPEALGKITQQFNVFTEISDIGQIDHNLVTAIITPDGTIERLWRGNQWTAREVLDTLRKMAPAL